MNKIESKEQLIETENSVGLAPPPPAAIFDLKPETANAIITPYV